MKQNMGLKEIFPLAFQVVHGKRKTVEKLKCLK
nr:MAG TPA: hypothetical protein [Caudoviricetes sp.]DAU56534.1 MAG TPA: hypothetical protein [Caudoviricetes sp.]